MLSGWDDHESRRLQESWGGRREPRSPGFIAGASIVVGEDCFMMVKLKLRTRKSYAWHDRTPRLRMTDRSIRRAEKGRRRWRERRFSRGDSPDFLLNQRSGPAQSVCFVPNTS
ncbi:hypothetical protein GE21DRAFT_9415 [Neurospora crassa]|uniref:Uncharacterized protein n=1 Tax=Neurospora crassa (strain ATCC 24698 / 74-OR23-1A / CBS 708.71 / DSM 1257 / FGSC 987) TaxID=367110 RepID=A7UW08_NEUCR|nr:hypothetical protein NCU11059 [Neurospora crassa OR74A]EDO65349.1 hypothetical protein NCU11059 [Neurospora crassa OR74A]KHE87544.1 hypothetical protein GE21DRAFT_9415 [Neurospora crassa]|eukprot:XP_001728440.1 hypothetical protein NCU11059 [Neurospora crassa OR74A]